MKNSFTLRQISKSSSFSARSTFRPISNNQVEISDWTFDSWGIIPSGTEKRIVPIETARAEYRNLKANGWS